jgi:eukaryotic-like serine/threonine-protein kinase
MGEVYRARDTRLDRTVAIKVLPEHLSSNPPLRERFEREAKAISSLSHPHICPLYDVGHQNGVDFLVMEYLEGETLAHRLKKGRLPPDQVLQYSIQITDALDTAHRHGVIHRDLKPGNIMLTKTGAKLLDFGLAKMRTAEAAAGMTALPTQTTPLTGAGTILGTLQYMAPEQLEGKEADSRTDIFAFGAVLYETATGRKAFEAKSQASLIAAILEHNPPPLSTVLRTTTPMLDRVLGKCLAKNPDDRWQTATDLRDELKWITEQGEQAATERVTGRRRYAGWLVAGILFAALLAWTSVQLGRKRLPERAVRFSVLPAEKTSLVSTYTAGPTPQAAISPDGYQLAFVASYPGSPRLIWVRALDSAVAQPLRGTEGARFPFWSPDSHFIGFFAGGKLNKIDASGGTPEPIADAPDGRGGTWAPDGTVVYAENIGGGLSRVAAAGGTPRDATVLDNARGEISHRFPQFLPDGRHFVFINRATSDTRGLYVASLDSTEKKRLLPSDWSSAFANTEYLLSVRQGSLFAHPFDARNLKLTGEPLVVAEQVGSGSPSGFAAFSVSAAGVLTYASGRSANRQLVWFSRDGKRLGSFGSPGEYSSPSLSPDQRKVAIARAHPQIRTPDIWILDLVRGTETRFTFDPGGEITPLWSPDGRRIVFSSDRTGTWELYQKDLSGAAADQLLARAAEGAFLSQWSGDGRFIIYQIPTPRTNWDLWCLSLKDLKATPFLATPFNEVQGALSPDGRWMAYTSDESGQPEVYVQAFPAGGGKLQVSVRGGSEPKWRTDGKELFYIGPDLKLMSVRVKSGSTLEAGVPSGLFEMPVPPFTPAYQNSYVPTPDGQRFLVNILVQDPTPTPITVVLNWAAGLKR